MYCKKSQRIVLILLFASIAVCAQTPKLKSFSATSHELLGLWSGEGEVIEFRSDGKVRYAGELYPYELSQGHLLIETPSGKVTFAYAIVDSKLVLTAQGQRSVYTKMTSGAQSETKKDRHPADLVGQWCYMKSTTGSYTGRCITLRADGTYLYQEESSRSVQTDQLAGGTASQGSDSGTWYLHGDRIYYQSTTEGAGSFKLERRNHPINKNDPMIVLDDEPFVTTMSRPPWK